MDETDTKDTPEGTQAIERAITVLRTLATRGRFGYGLTELAAVCELKKATTHRILARLERERLVHRRAQSDHYVIGPLLGELSLSIPGFHDFVDLARDYVNDLARRNGLVGLLCLLSGDHFVVAVRAASSRLKSELHEVGSRRPLIITAGGIAMLITLPRDRQERIVAGNLALLPDGGQAARTREYLRMWGRSSELGYGTNFGDLAIGVNAVAVPVQDQGGGSFASLTLGGPASYLSEQRCHELVPSLRSAAREVTALADSAHLQLYAAHAG
jgi:DNA-binding IclR family transcriptional regulator